VVVVDVPDPVPAAGQVVVNVAAAAVNFPDVLLVADQYQVHLPVPFTVGSEFAGTVRSVGDGVDGVSVGDRVMGSTMFGAFAEQIVVAASSLQPVHPGVELATAAASGVAHQTAYHALRSMAGLAAGEWAVILGAAGGVGLAAIQLGAALGGRMVAAVSSPEKMALCLARGAEVAVDYRTEDLKERIKEITGGGADIVVDPVGGPDAELALRAMRWGGRFVTVGFASGEIPRIPLNLVLLKGVVVSGFTMEGFGRHRRQERERDLAELAELAREGRAAPYISATYPLEEVSLALAELAERRAIGKVLVAPTR
jgi:NADPH:quinone reductase-like Zn-dependent oxidoreductase